MMHQTYAQRHSPHSAAAHGTAKGTGGHATHFTKALLEMGIVEMRHVGQAYHYAILLPLQEIPSRQIYHECLKTNLIKE